MSTKLTFQPRFGSYLLLKRIAIGGMAEIYRALFCGSEGFRKLVAIKRILPQFSQDASYVTMFTEEAKLVANLNHSNIVQLHDFGSIDGLLFHALEYVRGQNLTEIIRALQVANRSTPMEIGCQIISEVLRGLDYAHRRSDRFGKPLSIIHRDVSPSNILVSYDGEVRIADFGIAKAAQFGGSTKAGVVKGKFRYMSPEQAQGAVLDQRTDLFSLGLCAFELMTLSPMYHDENEFGLLRKVRECRIVKPRQLNPAIPEEFETILLKALAMNPEERYRSAAEWCDVMIRFMASSQIPLPSAKNLSEFMKGLFATTLQVEQEQIAKESKLAEELTSLAGTTMSDAESLAPRETPVPQQMPRRRPPIQTEQMYSDEEDTDETLKPKGPAESPPDQRPTLRKMEAVSETVGEANDTDKNALQAALPKPATVAQPDSPDPDLPLQARTTLRVMPCFDAKAKTIKNQLSSLPDAAEEEEAAKEEEPTSVDQPFGPKTPKE